MADKKGRRAINKTDGGRLPEHPPELLTADAERKAYLRIRADLMRAGYAQRCDLEQVLLLARRLARAETLSKEALGLKSVMMCDRIHPIYSELRTLEQSIQSSLGALCLTPRARSSSRAKASEVDLEMECSSPLQKKILSLMP